MVNERWWYWCFLLDFPSKKDLLTFTETFTHNTLPSGVMIQAS
jgi:hypothetical protein